MRTVALVPIKALAEAKGRLARLLTPEQRADLTLRLLRIVLAALDRPEIAATIVVSPDEAVLSATRSARIRTIMQHGGGLNEGVLAAREAAIARGADELLVVLGDLPLLTRDDVGAMLALADRDGTVVLAPDRHLRGTNAMVLRPADALAVAFGPNSLARHRVSALASEWIVRLYRAEGTALDLDTPDDLALLRQHPRARSLGLEGVLTAHE